MLALLKLPLITRRIICKTVTCKLKKRLKMPKNLFLLLTILIICSCNERKENQETKPKSEPKIQSKEKIKPELELGLLGIR